MKAYGCLFAIGWGLNFAWEMLHSSLYRDVPPLLAHLPFLFLAAIGDAAITLALVGVVALALKNCIWFLSRPSKGLALLVAVSAVASFGIEYVNVDVLQRWQYTAAMPRMPFASVGWSPFLQMALIPSVSALLASLRCSGFLSNR